MNYKALIPDAETRLKILQTLSFVPDKMMLKLQYRMKLGRKLNLKNPRRYSEKMQLYKLCYRDPLMQQCVDKYRVREYVESKIGDQYFNTLYGVYDDPDEVDFDALPEQFVLKDTLGSKGDLSMILVTNRDELDREKARKIMKEWVDEPTDTKNAGREWVYDGYKHRIIAEKLLIQDSQGDLPDYKFFCFNGKVYCMYVMTNYTMHHEKGIMGFFDRDYRMLPVHRADFAPMLQPSPKPKNYELMLELAEKLGADFPHVRVDFYNLDGKIIFGELTFFSASGYMRFEPDEFDFLMGEQFDLPMKKNR